MTVTAAGGVEKAAGGMVTAAGGVEKAATAPGGVVTAATAAGGVVTASGGGVAATESFKLAYTLGKAC